MRKSYYDKKNFGKYLLEDNKIRKFIKKKYYACAISSIAIDRTDKKLIITIATARPGILIGQKGAGVESLKKEVLKLTKADYVSINIKEVKNPKTPNNPDFIPPLEKIPLTNSTGAFNISIL